MSELCPKCGAANPKERHTCRLCGTELKTPSFAELFGGEMFGPPRQLHDRYTIQHPVHQGAHVNLYRAVDTKTNQPCLVHQAALTSFDLDMRDVLEHHFLEEAARWQARRHPNLLPILGADVQNHRLYLVTAPIKGISLKSIIQDRNQTIPEQTLLHWASQLCDALDYLHTQEPPVILGCLSPSAIHVDASGQVQIVQVGLIRYDRPGLSTPARGNEGAPGYAAPEQKTGQAMPQSDIYTLGIILYQLITRFDPKERPLPPLNKYSDGFTAPVVEAISRAYRREPEKRYASAADMRQALLGASPQQALRLPPFEITEGKLVNTLADLAQTCAANWDGGLLALLNGRTVEWLARCVDQLRRAGQEIEAEQVQQALERTVRAQEQIAREAVLPGQQEIALHAAFAAWLQDLGALGVQPSLEFHPARFDFGVLSPRVKAATTLQVRNKGQGYLTGRVESKLPWLTIPQPVFGCRAGETAQVRIEARGRNLPPGDVRAVNHTASAQAIHIVSTGGEAWLAAEASSSPPVLDVQPRTLDYGPITRGASRIAYLTLSNVGGGRLNGRVTTKAPWLRIRRPEFSCPAGASARIPIELLSAQLPEGAVRIRRALAVDSDSGQGAIDIAWQWARPGLELDVLSLDFGSIERAIAGQATQIRRAVTVSNSGTAELSGTVESRVPWLAVSTAGVPTAGVPTAGVPTAEFKCAPGASQRIEIICDVSQLPGGSTVEAEAVAIHANTGTQPLSATVEVLASELDIDETVINLGTLWDGEQAEETLMIGNRGALLWAGRVRPTANWLAVEPAEVRCEAGHSLPVIVSVKAEALAHSGEWSAAVQIEGMGERRTVGVRAFLARPQLNIARRSLDFGLIGRTEIAHLPLEIANSGAGELHWRVETQGTWLEAVPVEGACATGETAAVQLNAYALGVGGESGQAWITVHSNGGRADLPVRVGLSSPQLAVEPLTLELASENYAAAAQTLWVFNRGVGTLTGAVVPQVPWLTATPADFACPAGMSAPIEVQANPEGQREGTHQTDDALLVESNAGRQEIGVRLALKLTPRLHVETQELVFAGDSAAGQTLVLENQGHGTLHVQVIPADEWITVDRQEWTIKPQKKARVSVSVQPGDAAQGSIEIHAADQVIRLPVRREQQNA